MKTITTALATRMASTIQAKMSSMPPPWRSSDVSFDVYLAGSATSTLVQVLSGLNDVIASATLAVSGPRSF